MFFCSNLYVRILGIHPLFVVHYNTLSRTCTFTSPGSTLCPDYVVSLGVLVFCRWGRLGPSSQGFKKQTNDVVVSNTLGITNFVDREIVKILDQRFKKYAGTQASGSTENILGVFKVHSPGMSINSPTRSPGLSQNQS